MAGGRTSEYRQWLQDWVSQERQQAAAGRPSTPLRQAICAALVEDPQGRASARDILVLLTAFVAQQQE
jgi:hypothetical protein